MVIRGRTTVLCALAMLPAGLACAQDSASASATAVPAVVERDTASTLQINGFRVSGVQAHPEAGITPMAIQALLDEHFTQVSGGAPSVALTFAQLQQAAGKVTAAYRQAGFLVSTAFVPKQTISADRLLEIRVMEGRIGKVIVQGNQRYQRSAVGSVADRLAGSPVRHADIESALLYARDLPGVSVSSVLQPGENEGETDLVLIANEQAHPWSVSLGLDNHGTETSGRGRAQAALVWNNPLGRGDVLAVSGTYQFSPASSRNGALSYSLPVPAVTGLSVLAGANRSELEINDGPLAVLELSGPSSQRYLGADWKFRNTASLQMTASARLIREQSRFESMGIRLSDHRFDVAEIDASLLHLDSRWRGTHFAQLSVRQSLKDDSQGMDVVSPFRDDDFTIARLTLLRMQSLGRDQRLLGRLTGQYTDDGLPAMEQFQLGGHDTLRGYPLGEAMGDRGYVLGLEYQVDAPGLGERVSPFQGRAWREVLTLDVFAEQGEVSSVTGFAGSQRLSSAGLGMTLRLPSFHDLALRVAGAAPLGSVDASDGRSARLYARVSMTF